MWCNVCFLQVKYLFFLRLREKTTFKIIAMQPEGKVSFRLSEKEDLKKKNPALALLSWSMTMAIKLPPLSSWSNPHHRQTDKQTNKPNWCRTSAAQSYLWFLYLQITSTSISWQLCSGTGGTGAGPASSCTCFLAFQPTYHLFDTAFN